MKKSVKKGLGISALAIIALAIFCSQARKRKKK